MGEQSHFQQMSGAAVLLLERANDRICDCNDAAAEMLARQADELHGCTLWEALGIDYQEQLPLAVAIRSGVRTTVAPTLINPPTCAEMVVGGTLFSQQHEGRDVLVLLLFSLASSEQRYFAHPLGPADIVAVLGVDAIDSQSLWQPDDIARRMVDIRFGLQQIVPARQDVGLPEGSTIPVVLRDVTIEQSRDICMALLSHLTPLLGDSYRIRIGLAQRMPGESSLAALTAANNALLRLQSRGGSELIATADERLAQMRFPVCSDGIFTDSGQLATSRPYLAALAELEFDPHRAGDWLEDVTRTTAQQKGVASVAIYRRRYDDSYEFVNGVLAAEQDFSSATEKQLPRPLRQLVRKLDSDQLKAMDQLSSGRSSVAAFPLRVYDRLLGVMVLQYESGGPGSGSNFQPGAAAMHLMATQLASLSEWRQASDIPVQPQVAAAPPIDERIDGYVGDNMEGAIDQAIFLSGVDVPVAIIGPRGTGKLYVAKVIHQEAGAPPEMLVTIDCREFRSRKDALGRIARELERSAGKTLVFKSPHLMNPDAQLKLARQISSRVLADTSPPRYLPAARIIALFPDNLEHLVRHGGLNDRLASVFAAYPIRVPPIKDRKRAVLRWAHKILAQEAARRDRKVSGFTPDAQQALLQHDWPGNISEMRQCIVGALDKTGKEWLTPVDLGIFKGLAPAGRPDHPEKRAFLQVVVEDASEEDAYTPDTLDELGVALGEALNTLLELDTLKPLGAWLDDEVILAACERYRDNMRAAGDFLQTKPRNIGRWLPKILSRDHDRSSSSLWQKPQRIIHQWIREAPAQEMPPQQLLQGLLLSHVIAQCEDISVADRARIMGVSTPTYQKRLQDITG